MPLCHASYPFCKWQQLCDPVGTEDGACFVDPPSAELPFLELPQGRGNSWCLNSINSVKNCTCTNTYTQGIYGLRQRLSCDIGDHPGTSDAVLRNLARCRPLSTQPVLASFARGCPGLLSSLLCRQPWLAAPERGKCSCPRSCGSQPCT